MAQDPQQGTGFDWKAYREQRPLPDEMSFHQEPQNLASDFPSIDAAFEALASANPDYFEKEKVPTPEIEKKILTWDDAWGEMGKHKERFIPFVSAISETAELASLLVAAKASERGEATPEQLKSLIDFVSLAQADKTLGYHVAHILGMLPAFIGEVWVGAGIARQVGTKVMGKTIREIIEASSARNATRAFGRRMKLKGMALGDDALISAGTKLAGPRISLDIAGHRLGQAGGTFLATEAISGGAGLLTTGEYGSRGGASAYRRALSEAGMYVTEDEADELRLVMTGKPGDFLENLPMGLWDSLVEQISERAGRELIQLPGIRVLEKLKLQIAAKWMARRGASPSDLSRHLDRVGWHGPIEEWLEERFGGALRSLTMVGEDEFIWQREDGESGRMNWSTMWPGGKQALAEFIAFQVPGPAMATVRRIATGKPLTSEEAALTQEDIQVQLMHENSFNSQAEEWYGNNFETEHKLAKEQPETKDRLLDDRKFVNALAGKYGEEAQEKAWSDLRQDGELMELAALAGLEGVSPIASFEENSPQMREARAWVSQFDTNAEGKPDGSQARIVLPKTRLTERLTTLWENLLPGKQILWVEGGEEFNSRGSGMHTSTDGGTVYLSPRMASTGHFMPGLAVSGHEVFHGLPKEMQQMLANVIDDINGEWLDMAYLDGQTSWAHQEMRRRGQSTEETDSEYKENLAEAMAAAEANFVRQHGPQGSESYESAKREESVATLLTLSERLQSQEIAQIAPLFVFFSLHDGRALLEEARKKPGMIGSIREFFVRSAERLMGKKLPPGAEGRVQRILQNLLKTDITEDSDPHKVAIAFHEAFTGLLSASLEAESSALNVEQPEGEVAEEAPEAPEEAAMEEAPAVEEPMRGGDWVEDEGHDWDDDSLTEEAPTLEDSEVRRVMRSGNRSTLETQARDLGVEEPEGFKNKGELAAEIVRRQRAQGPREGDMFAPPVAMHHGSAVKGIEQFKGGEYFGTGSGGEVHGPGLYMAQLAKEAEGYMLEAERKSAKTFLGGEAVDPSSIQQDLLKDAPSASLKSLIDTVKKIVGRETMSDEEAREILSDFVHEKVLVKPRMEFTGVNVPGESATRIGWEKWIAQVKENIRDRVVAVEERLRRKDPSAWDKRYLGPTRTGPGFDLDDQRIRDLDRLADQLSATYEPGQVYEMEAPIEEDNSIWEGRKLSEQHPDVRRTGLQIIEDYDLEGIQAFGMGQIQGEETLANDLIRALEVKWQQAMTSKDHYTEMEKRSGMYTAVNDIPWAEKYESAADAVNKTLLDAGIVARKWAAFGHREESDPPFEAVLFRPEDATKIRGMYAPPFSLGPNAPGEFRRQADREAALRASRDDQSYKELMNTLVDTYYDDYAAYLDLKKDLLQMGILSKEEVKSFEAAGETYVFDLKGVGIRAPYMKIDDSLTRQEILELQGLQNRLIRELTNSIGVEADNTDLAERIWGIAQQVEAGFYDKYQYADNEADRKFWKDRWSTEHLSNIDLQELLRAQLPENFDFDEPMYAPPRDDLLFDATGTSPVLVAPTVTADQVPYLTTGDLPMKPPKELLLDGEKWLAWSPEGELLGVFDTLEDVPPGLLNTFTSPSAGGAYGLSFQMDPARTGAALEQAQELHKDLQKNVASLERKSAALKKEGASTEEIADAAREVAAARKEVKAAKQEITSERDRLGGNYRVSGATVGRPAGEGQTQPERSAIYVSKMSSKLTDVYDSLLGHPNAINVEGSTTYEASPAPQVDEATLMTDIGSEATTPEEVTKILDQLAAIDPGLKPSYEERGKRDFAAEEPTAKEAAEAEVEVEEEIRGARESVYRSKRGVDPFINFRRSEDGYVQWPGEADPTTRKSQQDELQALTDYAKASERSSSPTVKVAAQGLRIALEDAQHGEEPIFATIWKTGAKPAKALTATDGYGVHDRGMYLGLSPYNGEEITSGEFVTKEGKRFTRVSDGKVTVDVSSDHPAIIKPWHARKVLREGRMAEVDAKRNALTAAALSSEQQMAARRALTDMKTRQAIMEASGVEPTIAFENVIRQLEMAAGLREKHGLIFPEKGATTTYGPAHAAKMGELDPRYPVEKASEAKLKEHEEAKRHADFRSGRLTDGAYYAPVDPKASETKANRARVISELTDRVEEVKADVAEQARYADEAVRQVLNLPEGESVTTADRRTAIRTDYSLYDAQTRVRKTRRKLSNLEATLRHIKDGEGGYKDGRFLQGAAGSAIQQAMDQPTQHTVVIRGPGATLVPEINTRYNESDGSLRLLGGLLDEKEVTFLRSEMGLEKEIDEALKKQNSVAGAKLTMGQIRDLRAGGFDVDFVADFDARQSGKMRQSLLRDPGSLETWLTVEDGGAYLLEDIDGEELSAAERMSFVLDRLNVHDEKAQANLMGQLADIETDDRLDSIVKAYHMLRLGQHGAGTYTLLNQSSDTAMFAPPSGYDLNQNLMRPGWGRMHAALERVWNRLLPVEMMENELRARGIEITDKEWITLKEKLRSSQTDAEWVALSEKYEEPIRDWFERNQHNVSWWAAGAWLQAHHGITRNRVLQPYVKRTIEKYWAGGPYVLNKETGEQEINPDHNSREYRYWKKRDGKASGELDSTWEAQIKALKKGHAPSEAIAGAKDISEWEDTGKPLDLGEMAQLSHLVQRLGHKVLDIYVDAGLLDEVDADTMKRQYPDYVPFDVGGGAGLAEVGSALLLEGAMTDTEAEAWYQMSQKGSTGVSLTGSGIRHSYGRGTRPVNDPIARVIGRMDIAHQKAKRAVVGKALLDLARKSDELLGKGKHFTEILSEAPRKPYLAADGAFDTVPDTKWYDNPNIVVVFEKVIENGKAVSKRYGIKFESSNQRKQDGTIESALGTQVALALNGENMHDPGEVIQMIGHYTRFLAQLNTRMNPGFALPNLLRDTFQAYTNLAAQYGHGLAAAAVNPASVSKAIRIMFKAKRQVAAGIYDRAKADPAHPQHDSDIELVEKYREAGGFIVFLGGEGMIPHMDTKGEVMAYTNTPTTLSRIAMPVLKLKSAIELLNDTLENASRLAFFSYGLEHGIPSQTAPGKDMSVEELALGAKNLTVNFEQRGTHGSFINALWMFSNANIQSTARIISALSVAKGDNPLKRKMRPQAIKVLSQLTLGHMILGLLNQWVGGEDEEDGESYWDKVADYEKKVNTIIMLPGTNGKGIKIPQSYGYNVFPALGYMASDLITGSKTMSEIAPFMWSTTLDAFSPFGGAQELTDIIVPSAAKPLVEHARNRDWKGSPIYKDRYGDMTIPDSQLYFDNVSPFTRELTTWLNEVTGGDQFTSGSVAGFDTSINPATIEHILGSVTGGLGKFIGRTFDLALSPVTDKDVEFKGIPVIRRFGITENKHYARGLYRESRDEIIQAERQIEFAVQQRRMGKKIDAITTDQRFLHSMNALRRKIDSNIKKLREARNKLPVGDKRRDRLEEAELKLMSAFNKKFHERSVAYGV